MPFKSMLARSAAIVMLVATPGAAFAEACNVNLPAVEKRIADLEVGYSRVLSDISCEAPEADGKARELMCNSAYEPGAELWRMGRLDDLAWVYAYENATKSEVDHDSPPRDKKFIAARDACTDTACLCKLIVDHTNASLGGGSPYHQD